MKEEKAEKNQCAGDIVVEVFSLHPPVLEYSCSSPRTPHEVLGVNCRSGEQSCQNVVGGISRRTGNEDLWCCWVAQQDVDL